MKSLIDSEREELRHVVLETLAVRHPSALPVRSIARHVKTAMGFEVSPDDITAALVLLSGLAPSLVIATPDELGSSTYWAATSQGVLYYERKEK